MTIFFCTTLFRFLKVNVLLKVWVLTGDKVETALNVAYSCGHFKLGTQELDLINISNEIDCVSALRDVA